MKNLQKEFNHLLQNSVSQKSYPRINAWNKDDKVTVSAELPGVSPQDIDINVVEDTVTLEYKHEAKKLEDVTYHRRERRSKSFKRSFRLPFTIDQEQVSAEYRDGVLWISLVQIAEEKPRKIVVKSA